MKKVFQFILFFALSILLSAFLAPIVHSILPQFKFEKILNRLLMITIILTCVGTIRFGKDFFRECGLVKERVREGWLGWFISCLVLTVLAWTELQLGALQLKESFHFKIFFVVSSFATGITVGVIEELFFRGFLFLNFQKKTKSLLPALIMTNLIYSAVHFIKSGRPLIDSAPTMWDSFRVIGASFNQFTQWQSFWPGFIGLFLFGLVLSFAFLRTRSLYLPIGIHAGAVFFLKLTTKWYQVSPEHSQLIFGGKGFYSGILGWIFIMLIGVLVARLFPRTGSRPHKSLVF